MIRRCTSILCGWRGMGWLSRGERGVECTAVARAKDYRRDAENAEKPTATAARFDETEPAATNSTATSKAGAALRSRTAGSQDESPCRAIHKQRPYQCKTNSTAKLRRDAGATTSTALVRGSILPLFVRFCGPHDGSD